MEEGSSHCQNQGEGRAVGLVRTQNPKLRGQKTTLQLILAPQKDRHTTSLKQEQGNKGKQSFKKKRSRIYLQGSNGETDIENRLTDMGRAGARARRAARVTWGLPSPYVN